MAPKADKKHVSNTSNAPSIDLFFPEKTRSEKDYNNHVKCLEVCKRDIYLQLYTFQESSENNIVLKKMAGFLFAQFIQY